MAGTGAAVLGAFLLVLPVLLAVLGATALGRDRASGWILLLVVAGFGLVIGSAAQGAGAWRLGAVEPMAVAGLWLGGAAGLAIRLARDRSRRYRRGAVESLAVLGSGAILLATLLSLPSIFAELARLRGL